MIRLCIVVLLMLIAITVVADDERSSPSLELLEFLGDWNDGEGESATWIDPMNFSEEEERAVKVGDEEYDG